jgi:hypothetical protein
MIVQFPLSLIISMGCENESVRFNPNIHGIGLDSRRQVGHGALMQVRASGFIWSTPFGLCIAPENRNRLEHKAGLQTFLSLAYRHFCP